MLQSLLSLVECLVGISFHLAQRPLGLKDELIRIWWLKVKGHKSLWPHITRGFIRWLHTNRDTADQDQQNLIRSNNLYNHIQPWVSSCSSWHSLAYFQCFSRSCWEISIRHNSSLTPFLVYVSTQCGVMRRNTWSKTCSQATTRIFARWFILKTRCRFRSRWPSLTSSLWWGSTCTTFGWNCSEQQIHTFLR